MDDSSAMVRHWNNATANYMMKPFTLNAGGYEVYIKNRDSEVVALASANMLMRCFLVAYILIERPDAPLGGQTRCERSIWFLVVSASSTSNDVHNTIYLVWFRDSLIQRSIKVCG